MAGDDTLTGGNGNDRLIGGEGQDYFGFALSNRDPMGSFKLLGVDRILDFTPQQDKIAMWGSPTDFGLGFAKTEAQAARKFATLVYIQSTGMLYYNPNGQASGFAQGGAFAQLNRGTRLTPADFVEYQPLI
jgi:serralysin